MLLNHLEEQKCFEYFYNPRTTSTRTKPRLTKDQLVHRLNNILKLDTKAAQG